MTRWNKKRSQFSNCYTFTARPTIVAGGVLTKMELYHDLLSILKQRLNYYNLSPWSVTERYGKQRRKDGVPTSEQHKKKQTTNKCRHAGTERDHGASGLISLDCKRCFIWFINLNARWKFCGEWEVNGGLDCESYGALLSAPSHRERLSPSAVGSGCAKGKAPTGSIN